MSIQRENPLTRYARKGSSRIGLSLSGNGMAVVLTWNTLLKVRDLLYLANPSWSHFRHYFDRSWITDKDQSTPAFERMIRRERISDSERQRLERLINGLIIRQDFPLHPTADILRTYCAKGRQSHPRRMFGTIYNGLMMELVPLSIAQLLKSPDTIVLQEKGTRLYSLQVFLGTQVIGPRSSRGISANLVSFYDRTLHRDLSLNQLRQYRWYRVANYEPAPGFTVVN